MAAAETALSAFLPHFEVAHLAGFRRKLGLFTAEPGDAELGRSYVKCIIVTSVAGGGRT